MKKLLSILASPWLATILLIIFATTVSIATFIESRQSTEIAWKLVYNAKWFELILLLGVINLSLSVFQRKLYRKQKFSIFLFHMAFVVILFGAGITRYFGFEGTMQIREGQSSNEVIVGGSEIVKLPFKLHLNDFIIEYYPGSQNPSGFASKVVLDDKEEGIFEERKIYMNNILKHKGYRFYQSSYTEDQKGTILSVSKDLIGTNITYLGYILLALGMIWSLFNSKSRFAFLIRRHTVTTSIAFLLLLGNSAIANDSIPKVDIPEIPLSHAEAFGEILVRDPQGRTKPINTLAEDIFRKVNRKDAYKEQKAIQVLLGMFVYPNNWQNEKIVYAGKNVPGIIDIEGKYASLKECYIGQRVFLSSMQAMQAYRIPPAQRSKAQNDLIRFDERINILYQWFGGTMLNIFPVPGDTTTNWYNPINIQGRVSSADSVFLYSVIHVYFGEVRNAMESGNWQTADEIVTGIKQFQQKYGDNMPSEKKVSLEKWYYKAQVFKRISNYYLLFGLILLIIILVQVFKPSVKAKWPEQILVLLLGGTLIIHTIGLGIRWYLSGHAPWSNAYETMVFIAWSGVLAGILFVGKNKTALALAAILAWIFLFAGHMSWMDPQLTNLVPVLKSKWLVIHVAIITSSYGFLGIGTLMAFVNLIMMSLQNQKNYKYSQESISNLSRIIELVTTLGVYLLTIGTFLGAVWANVSWGRYWAWDPKETWALITILVYAIVLHFRLIPALKGQVLFNFSSVIAYASVMMTYFGVNYYLSGLHSYATGDPAPIPKGVYYALRVIAIVTLAAIMNQVALKRKGLVDK